MALFKSKEERRIERSIVVRKTLGMFAGQIKKLAKQEAGYVASAQEACCVGAGSQAALAKKALKATMVQRRRLEHQVLTLKIASQMRDQAEMHGMFAKALAAVSKTIGDMFAAVDMTATQKKFEVAMGKAESMEQRVDLFLETSNETVFGEPTDGGEIVSDAEIDKLIDIETADAESGFDDGVEAKLREVQDALARE